MSRITKRTESILTGWAIRSANQWLESRGFAVETGWGDASLTPHAPMSRSRSHLGRPRSISPAKLIEAALRRNGTDTRNRRHPIQQFYERTFLPPQNRDEYWAARRNDVQHAACCVAGVLQLLPRSAYCGGVFVIACGFIGGCLSVNVSGEVGLATYQRPRVDAIMQMIKSRLLATGACNVHTTESRSMIVTPIVDALK